MQHTARSSLFITFIMAASLSFAQRQVQLTTTTLPLLTDVEGPPDINPYFDQFQINSGTLIYPYSKRIAFTSQTTTIGYRALHLENEYLRCTVLPEVGGHLYGCLDKLSGKEMFYNNPDLRKAWVGTRGAWAAFGIELNFPVGHSWVAISPVDYGSAENADGSASVWVANTDRVAGMRWTVEFRLRPGAAILEQHVTLSNPTAHRRRYYWWANASIRVEDQRTSFIYPTYLMARHDFIDVIAWPHIRPGLDLTEVGKFPSGIGYFTHGCREPFMAAYHPSTRAGVVHYADSNEVPGKKLWTWGPDNYPRQNLSRDRSTYIEIQGGLFENQETFGYLAPFDSRRFTEYWMPVRDLGGVTRSELAGTLYARRDAAGPLRIEFLPYRPETAARLTIAAGETTLFDEELDLDPQQILRRTLDAPGAPPFTLQITDAGGTVLLAHREDTFHAVTPTEFPPGPQATPSWRASPQTEEDFLNLGNWHESQWRPDQAVNAYRTASERFPANVEFSKSAGRLSLLLTRPEEALTRFNRPELAADAESIFYTGVAHELLGNDAVARQSYEAAAADEGWKAASAAALAYLAVRSGNPQQALDLQPPAALKLAALRRLDRKDEAVQLLFAARTADPADPILRFEESLLIGEDDAFWSHLSADPERVLDLVDHYLKLGAFDEARSLLERTYPAVPDHEAEPKAVRPQQHPLILYYLGYVKEKLGASGAADYAGASAATVDYIFPNRPSTQRVLEAAIRHNASDFAAHYLLGGLLLHFRKTDEAIAAWQKARQLKPGILTLHRNLGRALLDVKNDPRAALVVLQEGLTHDPNNQDLRNAITRARLAAP